ncbi:hypothetical protein NQ318_015619, partial [Aromia moschata]
DFNLNYTSNDFYNVKFKNLLNIYGVTQCVTRFTRITDNSSSLVDYVLTNFDELDVRVHHIPKITDHSVISVNFCKNKAFLGTNIVKAFRNFSTLKMHDINLELINTDFFIKLNRQRIVCLGMILKLRINLSKEMLHTNNLSTIEMKNYRNEVVNLLKAKKQQYYYNKIDTYKHNSVKMWKTLKTLMNTKNVSSNIRSIQFDIEGDIKEIKDDTNIAEQFNVYFIESIKDIINNIDTDNNWNDIDNNVNIQSKFDEFKLINLCDLSKIINNLDGRCSIHEKE